MTQLNCYVIFQVLFLFACAAEGLSGEVSDVEAMRFGTIFSHPDGDVIIIDASDGPATPEAARSHVEGGRSGAISFISDIDGEMVQIDYPSTVTLSDGSHSITIQNIPERSQYSDSDLALKNGETVDAAIGGELILTAKEVPANYSGRMNIQLIFK